MYNFLSFCTIILFLFSSKKLKTAKDSTSTTKNYIFYKENAIGIDNSEVIYQKVDAKSIGNSTTYEKDLEDESEIRNALKALSKSVSDNVIYRWTGTEYVALSSAGFKEDTTINIICEV